MNPRRPLGTLEKVKVRTLSVEQRTEEDSEYCCMVAWPSWSLGEGHLQLPVLSRIKQPNCFQHCSFPFPGHAETRKSAVSHLAVLHVTLLMVSLRAKRCCLGSCKGSETLWGCSVEAARLLLGWDQAGL